jgi:hemerythrin-like domain-containing protein
MPAHSASRRHFLLAGTAAGSGLTLLGLPGIARADEKDEEDVSPPEDLMREHGVLNRILLIYDEYLRRLHAGEKVEPGLLAAAAKIVRMFIEDYHEKLEEDHLFPRFEKAGKQVELVKVLRDQHQAGRRLTDEILQSATPAAMAEARGVKKLTHALAQFNRMYRPHEAREDTVLFPALREIMKPKEFDAMGEQFEEREHQLFGEHGFENIVAQVAELEKGLGIYDLGRFTPTP